MANFSPVSETNPLKIKLSITWRGIQPGPKILARYFQTRLDFQPGQTGWKIHVTAFFFFHPGPKKEHKHAHRLCFRASVNLEIYVLRTGWNWACNRNNISARWAERNLSPGWNSPCNQDPRKMKPLPLNSEEYGQAISQAIEGRHCMEPTT